MKYGYIYKIVHLPSGHYYIGQHKGGFDNKYWGSGRVINLFIKKYPIKEFSREILAWANSQEELNSLEEHYIGDKFAKDSMCLNLKSGGEGHEFSKETKQKMKDCFNEEKKQKYKNMLKERWKNSDVMQRALASESFKEKMRKRMKGNKNLLGHKHTAKTRKKMSENSARLGFRGKHTDQTKEKLSEKTRLRNLCDQEYRAKHSAWLSSHNKGRQWFNNGVINKFCYECPDGFTKGQMQRKIKL